MVTVDRTDPIKFDINDTTDVHWPLHRHVQRGPILNTHLVSSNSFHINFYLRNLILDDWMTWFRFLPLFCISSSFYEFHSYVLFIGCIADRDLHPGWSILENITEAITKSYKVILILTDHFIKSKWCEYQALIVRSLESRQSCVIFILLEQCEIPNKLRHLTYLDLTLDNNSLTELQKLNDELLPGDEMINNRN